MINKIVELLEKLDVEDIDLESDFMEIPLKHHRYELNRTTPFVWYLDPNDEKKTIKIKLVVDKNAIAEDKDINTIVLDTIKNNQAFKDFVDSLKSLEPDNDQIKNLYNLDSYKVINKKSTRAYVKYIKFGV